MTPKPEPKTPSKTPESKTPQKTEAAPRPDPTPAAALTKNTSSQPSTGAATTLTSEPAPKVEEPSVMVAPGGAETHEPSADGHQVPKKIDDGEAKKPFTVQIPAGTMRILGVISRAEGRSISEIILQALAQADLRSRARKALEALAREIE